MDGKALCWKTGLISHAVLAAGLLISVSLGPIPVMAEEVGRVYLGTLNSAADYRQVAFQDEAADEASDDKADDTAGAATPPARQTPTQGQAPARPPASVNRPPAPAPGTTTQLPPPSQTQYAQTSLQVPSRQPSYGFNRLANSPQMIGDNPFTGQQGFFTANDVGGSLIDGGSLDTFVSHPAQGGLRVNLAESGSPLVQDRGIFEYRRFSNVADVRFLGSTPEADRETVGFDRILVGLEKAVFDSTSIEVRLPFYTSLDGDVFFQSQGNGNTATNSTETQTFIGNINFVLKQALMERRKFYVSGGMALTLPTSDGFSTNLQINDNAFDLVDLGGAPTTANLQLDMTASQTNETVNLTPFLAAIWTPNQDWIIQGFFQVDVPLNSSTVNFISNSAVNGTAVGVIQDTAEISQQTLARLNIGVSRWLTTGTFLRSPYTLSFTFEAHYTTSLNEADIVGPFQITNDLGGGIPLLLAGNRENRVDTTNLVIGLPLTFSRVQITNAVAFPVTEGPGDKVFDAEYALLVGIVY